MTLFKQLAIVISLVFFLIFISTTISDIRRSIAFVEGQQQSMVRDMVTNLGVTISNSTVTDGPPVYETLFNAVFDSGYYSSIELIASDGKTIHRKDRPIEMQGVPDWFVSLVPLSPAIGTTNILKGWVPLGTLRLTLHPGYVYESLFRNIKVSLFWLVILFLLGMGVLWLLLHQILKPLNSVKQQADLIRKNKFVKQTALPRTLELRTVVEAMNKMIDKVHDNFSMQEKTFTRYQKLLFEDELTGLGSREYFLAELEKTQKEDATFVGDVVVFKIHNFDNFNAAEGYEKTESVIKLVANLLLSASSGGRSSRLSLDEFAFLSSDSSKSSLTCIEEVFDGFRNSNIAPSISSELSLVAGVTNIQTGSIVGKILSRVDFALSQAMSKGAYSIVNEKIQTVLLPEGKIQWREWLENSITKNRYFLVKQNSYDLNMNVTHQEVFVRLKNEEDEVVTAGIFMPVAATLGLSDSIEYKVFELVKKYSEKQDGIPVAFNLAESIFVRADALFEFNQLLSYFYKQKRHLNFEVSHSIIEQYPSMCAEVAESVRSSGHLFGVDNINLTHSLKILKSVRPDYIKVDAGALYDMTSGKITSGFDALVSLTKAMDIKLVAVGVNSQDVLEHMHALKVDGIQGNLLSSVENI